MGTEQAEAMERDRQDVWTSFRYSSTDESTSTGDHLDPE